MIRQARTFVLCLVLSGMNAGFSAVDPLKAAEENVAAAEGESSPQALGAQDAETFSEGEIEPELVGAEVLGGACCETWFGGDSLFDPPTSGYPGHERIHRAFLLGRLWMRGEYLAWSISKTRLPPLLAGVEAGAGNPPADPAGADLQVLFGDFDAHDALRSGGRFRTGLWFTPDQITGIEVAFLGLDDQDIRHLAHGDNVPVLARPFVDAQTGLADAVLVSYPNLQLGATFIRSDVETLAAEAIWRTMIRAGDGSRLDILAGYRYLRLLDLLSIQDAFVSLDGGSGFAQGTIVDRRDLFQSENEFHGGDLGLIARWWNYRWALETVGRIAWGGTRTAALVDGLSVQEEVLPGGGTAVTTSPGGMLALPSNMGRHAQSEFAAVAELGVRLEYALTRQCRATLGYTLIWWSSAARVVDSVDLRVDPSQIPFGVNPSATQPEFTFRNGEFWMQGLSVGLQYDF